MPWAISNASPLINLAAISRFPLLCDFFDEVVISPAVCREVVTEGRGRPGAVEVEQAEDDGWLRVVKLGDDKLYRLLRRDLHDGEAETITLAVEQPADIVLLDESEARKVADTYSLNKTGTIGLLIRAKNEGKIPALKGALDRLQNDAGFWIDDTLYAQALAAVGESEVSGVSAKGCEQRNL